MNDAFCFDLDGTVTAREILPMLAAEVGFYEEIRALTDATIKGIIPFDSSFRLRCKILADIPIPRVHAIIRSAPLFPKIVRFIDARRDRCYLVSGNLDVWIKPLIDELGVEAFTSAASVAGDRLLGVASVLDKGRAVEAVRSRHDRIVAIGDGMGDVAMFEKADVRIAFGGLHRPVEALLQMSDMLCLSETALVNVLETLA
jgi:HAD superfamily phosphoserine phosphatase-like hydrolase